MRALAIPLKIRRVLATILTVAFLAAGPTIVWWKFFTDLPFDEAKWKAANWEDFFNFRSRMCDSLVADRLSPGMKRADVYSLIGKPDLEFPVAGSGGYAECFSDSQQTDLILVYRVRQGYLPGVGFKNLYLLCSAVDADPKVHQSGSDPRLKSAPP